jgi:hypothetical protein
MQRKGPPIASDGPGRQVSRPGPRVRGLTGSGIWPGNVHHLLWWPPEVRADGKGPRQEMSATVTHPWCEGKFYGFPSSKT